MATESLSIRVPLYCEQQPIGIAGAARIIVAGSRGYDNRVAFHRYLLDYLREEHLDNHVVFFSGLARSGADLLIVQWCQRYPYRVFGFKADWDTYGKRAGILRNCEMAQHATHLLVFWDGQSPGTKHMVQEAKRKGLKVKVIVYNKYDDQNRLAA